MTTTNFYQAKTQDTIYKMYFNRFQMFSTEFFRLFRIKCFYYELKLVFVKAWFRSNFSQLQLTNFVIYFQTKNVKYQI